MQFAQLLLTASLIAATSAKIAFTTLPASVKAGVPTKLSWAGEDPSQPVTITLKQGPPNDLTTVAIITGKATGSSYTWTPSKSLPDGSDYALQISQGVDDVNYSGEFALSGGSAAGASVTASASSAESSLISPQSVTSAAAVSSAVASVNGVASSLVASISNLTSSAATNATATRTVAVGTGAIGTVGVGTLSAATGTALHRNTTMSHATLTSKSTKTAAATTTTGSASTTSGSSASATTSSSKSDAVGLASPLAFVLFAAGAMVFLG